MRQEVAFVGEDSPFSDEQRQCEELRHFPASVFGNLILGFSRGRVWVESIVLGSRG